MNYEYERGDTNDLFVADLFLGIFFEGEFNKF